MDPQKIAEVIRHENSGKTPVHLYKFGSSYFISEGMHRSVLAKFLELESMRCLVTEYIFDGFSN